MAGALSGGAGLIFATRALDEAKAFHGVAMATAARDHCHGRCPGEESAYLACFAFFALEDGDPDNLIRANGEPVHLIGD